MTPTNDKVDQSGADERANLEQFKQALRSLFHADDYGKSTWEACTAREKALMLKAWNARALQAQPSAPANMPASDAVILSNEWVNKAYRLINEYGQRENEAGGDGVENGHAVHASYKALIEFVNASAAAPQQPVAASEAAPDQEEDAYVIKRLSTILADVAIVLKGEELPLHRHSYHDLADVARTLKLEVELHRMQEAERNASTNQPVQAKALTDDEIRILLDEALRIQSENYGNGSETHMKLSTWADKARALLASQPSAQPIAKQEPEWINDPHDIEQGMMRNPKYKPQQSAPADVAAVRDAALVIPQPDSITSSMLNAAKVTLEFVTERECKAFLAAIKSAAPTAQPQAGQCDLKKAHGIIADLLICFDDGVGEDWNKDQLAAAREFCDEDIYNDRIGAHSLGKNMGATTAQPQAEVKK